MATVMTRWDPFGELSELRTRLDRAFGDPGASPDHPWTPAIDIVRDNGNLVLRADVPGITPDEVKIEVQDDVLTIQGSHEENTERADKNYVRRERRYGSFSRSMTLPSGVDPSTIKAHTKAGVVEVTIPMPAQDKPAKVTITPTAG
ncbi:MAG TPA: Hsp20/alpha crystallin family protein [Solirubrobacteraceae bacterium]|nr:Hsp20/alpha crystallin family protein [Solirubrobacteraceae bacterium]